MITVRARYRAPRSGIYLCQINGGGTTIRLLSPRPPSGDEGFLYGEETSMTDYDDDGWKYA